MKDNLKSNIQLCKDLYDERLGVGNWALTNHGGGTKVLVKNETGFHYAYCQLKQKMVDDINFFFGNDEKLLLHHSFGGK